MIAARMRRNKNAVNFPLAPARVVALDARRPLIPFKSAPDRRKTLRYLQGVDPTMQFQWIDTVAVRDEAAGNRYLPRSRPA